MVQLALPILFIIACCDISSEFTTIIKAIEENISPGPVTQQNVTYTLYTRNYNGTFLTRDNLNILDPNLPTVILIHGWTEDGNASFYGPAAEAILRHRDTNVITIDYSDTADLFYPTSVSLANDTGVLIAEFIIDIHTNHSISLKTMEVVGFSLGAQVAGYSTRFVTSKTGSKINRATALDPAGPLFWDFVSSTDNIASGDADIVVCIHTDAGVFGSFRAACDIDIYPSGGMQPQPGCGLLDAGCSHDRSTELYVESIQNPQGFVSTQCSFWFWYLLGGCNGNRNITIGGNLTKEYSGQYFLQTNSKPPYSLS